METNDTVISSELKNINSMVKADLILNIKAVKDNKEIHQTPKDVSIIVSYWSIHIHSSNA